MTATARTFRDRREAGRVLARDLVDYRDRTDVLVLGLARGGLPVAQRGRGVPACARWTCAWSASSACRSGPNWPWARWPPAAASCSTTTCCAASRSPTTRCVRCWTGRRSSCTAARVRTGPAGIRSTLTGRTAILVDDGIATGREHGRRGAFGTPGGRRARRRRGAGRSGRGVPDAADEADDVVCSTMPADFHAVGQVYGDFHQIGDAEVRELLDDRARARRIRLRDRAFQLRGGSSSARSAATGASSSYSAATGASSG